MSNLEIKKNKKLVLNDVLMKGFLNITPEELDQEMIDFSNLLKLLKVKTRGPLITRNSGTIVNGDGTYTNDYNLMVQAYSLERYSKEFITKKRVEYSNCIYLQFNGHPQDLRYAHMKLELFFFEEGLISDGSLITVIVSQTTDEVTVDFFKPVGEV